MPYIVADPAPSVPRPARRRAGHLPDFVTLIHTGYFMKTVELRRAVSILARCCVLSLAVSDLGESRECMDAVMSTDSTR